ncbi:hypothetical protein HZF08_11645 [Paenibacillus sp. CGMCC 1.16610]|uniref:Immunity protein 30 domain-containing protein n=1 Tax=Paenibacillus anseongense TaxID=2682845 RepID=A0ABW9U6N8_9BACL|nr:hypothetical protein [Paenibacillus sp. CGMCC 1.16610]MVQ34925.1 hypothetical protein [Paenibacillus anseongense]
MENRTLVSQQEITKFENAIQDIINLNELSSIKFLCSGFYDETDYDEVMFNLIHAIESFDQKYKLEVTLKELAVSIPVMLPHAREWAKVLHKRILNHPPSLVVYIQIVKNLDVMNRNVIISLVTEIKNKNHAKFAEAVDQLLSAI